MYTCPNTYQRGIQTMKKRVLTLALALIMMVSLFGATASAQTLCIDVPDDVKYVTDLNWIKSGNIVFYPESMLESDGAYPVVVWANGTCCPTVTYYSLCALMAQRGYIVVANTELMAADGKEQIASLDYILAKNADPTSIFYGKVDADRIGAAGHSQGGRSAVNAAAADLRIKALVSVAGSSLKSEVKGLDTPALFLTGTADLIVLSSLWVKPAYKAAEGPAAYASMKLAPHTTCWFKPDAIVQYAAAWFDAFLNGDAAARAVFMPGGELSTDSAWTDFASKNIA